MQRMKDFLFIEAKRLNKHYSMIIKTLLKTCDAGLIVYPVENKNDVAIGLLCQCPSNLQLYADVFSSPYEKADYFKLSYHQATDFFFRFDSFNDVFETQDWNRILFLKNGSAVFDCWDEGACIYDQIITESQLKRK